MTHTETDPRLTMQWIAVTDDNGRTRMEARWSVVAEADAPARHAA